MLEIPFFFPALGGALIGLSASILWAFNGRVAGISGILNRLIQNAPEKGWRAAFLLGLLAGGIIFLSITPENFMIDVNRSPLAFTFAGIFVGFGTTLANGCTSGHGVCGISRLSPRSLIATLSFMSAAIACVALVETFWAGRI